MTSACWDDKLMKLMSQWSSDVTTTDEALQQLIGFGLDLPKVDEAPSSCVLRKISLLTSTKDCLLLTYGFSKFLATVCVRFPEIPFWRQLFQEEENSSLASEFLGEVIKQMPRKRELQNIIPALISNLNLKSFLKFYPDGKEASYVICQKLSFLEQCFQVDEIGETEEFLQKMLSEWDSLVSFLRYCFYSETCCIHRRALSYISAYFGFFLHRICRKHELTQSAFFKALCVNATVVAGLVVRNKTFCQASHWFGSGHFTENSAMGTIFCKSTTLIILQCLAIEVLTQTEESEPLLDRLSSIMSFFSSSEEIVSLFMSNDEQLMELMICTCIIWPKVRMNYDLSKLLAPNKFWLFILHKINWDESVILDWLTSEESALLMLLYYLKHLCNNWDDFCIHAKHYQLPKDDYQKLPTYPSCSEKALEIRVTEDLGGIFQQKTVCLCQEINPQKESSSKCDYSEQFREKEYLDATLKLFGKLRTKLSRLYEGGVLGFNPRSVIKLLENIERLK